MSKSKLSKIGQESSDCNMSLLFLKQRIEDNMFDGVTLDEFKLCKAYKPNEIFSNWKLEHNYIHSIFGRNNNPFANVHIRYNPKAKFDYITHQCCKHDGTLMFVTDTLLRMFNKLLNCETYFTDKPAPHENCEVYYTIGDFIEMNRMCLPEEWTQPWAQMRTGWFLPIKYEIKEVSELKKFYLYDFHLTEGK